MKIRIYCTVLLAFILVSNVMFSQNVNHFKNSDSRWNVSTTIPNGNAQNPSFIETKTQVYGFSGDSLEAGKQWFKVYSTADSSFQNNLKYRGLLREENNSVYYLDTLNQLDTLYDFNLVVGDSVRFTFNVTTYEWLKVNKVDSVTLNGQYYKRLKFAEPVISAFDIFNEQWIEGIGSIHGPIFPNSPQKFATESPDSMLLTCSYSNGTQVWKHGSYSNCYNNIVLHSRAVLSDNVKTYPNPVRDWLHFGSKELSYKVLNSLGTVVLQGNGNSVDCLGLSSGVYYLQLNDGAQTNVSKFIKVGN